MKECISDKASKLLQYLLISLLEVQNEHLLLKL